jgi:hypothetical protein
MTDAVATDQRAENIPSTTGATMRGGSIKVIDFHRDGNSAPYRTFGWSGQETTHVWSLQGVSGLLLPPRDEDHPLTLEVDVGVPVIEPVINGAVLRVMVNGRRIAATIVRRRTLVRCQIPQGVVRRGQPIEIQFQHPCYSRVDMTRGDSVDDRVLGISFYALYLFPPWMAPSARILPHRVPDDRLQEAAVWEDERLSAKSTKYAYEFGLGASGSSLLVSGWRHDREGNAWSDRRESCLELPAPIEPGTYYARIAFTPLFIRTKLHAQRITIVVNGCVVGQFHTGTAIDIIVPLPEEITKDTESLNFAFVAPDGYPMHVLDGSPAPYFLSFLLRRIEICSVGEGAHARLLMMRQDDITLPQPIAQSARFLNEEYDVLLDALRGQYEIAISEIMSLFESLGDNCSFGLAQRKAGAEPLSLLRFGNTPLASLTLALDDEFKALMQNSEIQLRREINSDAEWELHVDRYGIRWHTGVIAAAADEDTVFAQQSVRLRYLRRKFYETLRSGRKILTISRAEPLKHDNVYPVANELPLWEEKPEPLRAAEILPPLLKLNEYGYNTVLFLTRCEHGRQPGTVEMIAPGFLRGYVDDFVILADPNLQDHVTWLRIVINAWLLTQDADTDSQRTAEA